ncbi:MAG: LysR family transcriptional regulator [Oscillospiraceae bacterium]|nr:LysR family transcriptional regulator [Oscillospiraceae bacterium]
MTKAQVECLMAVSKYQSFSRAATHMYISQPAVSKQVSQLEKDLSLTLLQRTHSGIQLTEAGKLFYRFFQKYQTDFQNIWDAARRLSTQENGTIRLGCLDGWDISSFYPQLRELWEEKYPEIKISLDGYNHLTVLDAIQGGAIDIGITLEITVENRPELSVRKLTSAPSVMLFSGLNPLAQKEEPTLSDFRDDPFYVIAPQAAGATPWSSWPWTSATRPGLSLKSSTSPARRPS